MKYVVSWEPRESWNEETAARSLQVFGTWAPSEGTTFLEFLGRIDGRGGFSVVETDDPSLILKDMALFGVFFEFSVHPVLEIGDVAAIDMEAVARLASIT